MSQHGTILIAEDNDDDYFLVELACNRAGLRLPVVRVVDGLEAQDYLLGRGKFSDRKECPLPKMVVADLKMPRRNGLELLEWMRAKPEFRRIPFIFLTSSGHQSDIDRAYDLCANSYLVKPIKLEEFVDLLKQVQKYWLDTNRSATPVREPED